MMIQYVALLFLVAVPSVPLANAAQQVPGQVTEERVAEFVETMTRLHQIETRLRQHRAVDEAARQFARQSLDVLQVELPPETPGALIHKGYRLRLLVLLEERNEAVKLARELAATETWVGEGISVPGVLAVRQGEREAIVYQRLWADLFPLSQVTQWADNSRNVVPEDAIFARTEAPIIPMVRRDQLQEIGRIWEQSGRYDEAALSYREAVFCEGWLRFERIAIHEGWLSLTTAPLWFRVAENDWRAGRQMEAFESLAKGMVFGNDQHFAEGKQLAERLARPAERPADDPAQLDADTLLRIITLYREMNAHPRAMWLLEEHRDLFAEDAWQAAWDDVTREWLERVKGHLAMYVIREGEIYLFGHNVFPEDQRLKVRVPPAYHPEALERLRRAVEVKDQ